MALVNSRSVVNKTFILNDLFTSQRLDFLFLTETWINQVHPMLPVVMASVFKKKFDYRSIKTFSSFKVQLMQIDSRNPVILIFISVVPQMGW